MRQSADAIVVAEAGEIIRHRDHACPASRGEGCRRRGILTQSASAAAAIRPKAVLVAVRGALQRVDLRVPGRGEMRLIQVGSDGNLEVDRVEEVVLLEKRQGQRDPAQPVVVEQVTPTTVRRVRRARHGPQGKNLVGTFVVGEGQAELFQVVGALGTPGRLRADCTAGNNSAIKTAMMAMTTSSSISVKPLTRRGGIRSYPSRYTPSRFGMRARDRPMPGVPGRPGISSRHLGREQKTLLVCPAQTRCSTPT